MPFGRRDNRDGRPAARFNVALRHYEQAVDNYTDNNFEACNSQLIGFFTGGSCS